MPAEGTETRLAPLLERGEERGCLELSEPESLAEELALDDEEAGRVDAELDRIPIHVADRERKLARVERELQALRSRSRSPRGVAG